MSNTRTESLSQAGVSIWLDDLSRTLMSSGKLQEFIDEFNVVGVTTNPTIFAQAIGSGTGYTDDIAECAARGLSAEATAVHLSCTDVARACDLFAPIFAATHGVDGRVSIEVSPLLAHDAAGTIAEARRLWEQIDRPNVMIKIPATPAGLEAIAEVIGAGISVNVTLIFSLSRYRQVANAYFTGLERARAAGIDLSTIHSVASVFVSRFDTLVDPQLDARDTPEAREVRATMGLANARLAHEIAQEAHTSERARMLLASGAHPQRPLWASTGVKDPTIPDTRYVSGLVSEGVVNTMPVATLHAFADHGTVESGAMHQYYRDADQALNTIDSLGIDYAAVVSQLEAEGLQKFEQSWHELLRSVTLAREGQS